MWDSVPDPQNKDKSTHFKNCSYTEWDREHLAKKKPEKNWIVNKYWLPLISSSLPNVPRKSNTVLLNLKSM